MRIFSRGEGIFGMVYGFMGLWVDKVYGLSTVLFYYNVISCYLNALNFLQNSAEVSPFGRDDSP